MAGASDAPSGELELELAAMQACYVQLKHLVPTVPLNVELSRLQLLQHVIDYIVDLELALHSSASVSSSPRQRHQQQQPPSAKSCSSQKHGGDEQPLSSVSLADVRNSALCVDDDTIRHSSSPAVGLSRTHCDDTEPRSCQL